MRQKLIERGLLKGAGLYGVPSMNKSDKRLRYLRRWNITRALAHTWGSLNTHLYDSVNAAKGSHARGNPEWNARCVREYGETIYALSVELHELAKIEFRRDVHRLRQEAMKCWPKEKNS